ncbi:hypothetical protein CCACVL1_29801, partial [Corchorus capsularis]
MANGGLAEVKRKHVQYSKFLGVGSQASISSHTMLSSRAAMVLVYAPSLINDVASFIVFPGEGFRFLLFKSAITIHYGKRVFEDSARASPRPGVCNLLMVKGFIGIAITIVGLSKRKSVFGRVE